MGKTGEIQTSERSLKAGRFYGELVREHEGSGLILSEIRHNRARKIPDHWHELASFSLLLDGHYLDFYGKGTVSLKPLTVLFQPRAITHRAEVPAVGVRLLFVEVRDPWLQRLRECGVVPESSVHLAGSELSWLAARLYREYRDINQCAGLAIEGLVLEMLGSIARRPIFHERQPPEWLPRVVDFLNESFHQNLTIRRMATEFDLHPVYLSTVFRQFQKQSIGEYLHKARIEFARGELSKPETNLADLAAKAGFADQSHFTRVFRRFTGMTPGAYRALFMSQEQTNRRNSAG